MSNEVTVVDFNKAELEGVETSKADQIKKTFQPMADMLKEFEGLYASVIKEAEKEVTEEVTAKAKRLRLDIAQVRIKAEKIKKAEKEEYVRAGKAVDGVFNILKWAVTKKEENLKSIEKHFELIERVKYDKLQASRVEELSQFVDDAEERDLGDMDDDVWDAYIGAKKKAHADRIAAEKKAEEDRIAAEKKAEEERLAREEEARKERVRIQEENERLKKEADEKARQEEIERSRRDEEEKKRQAKEAAERKARDEAEKKRLAKESAERKKREDDARKLKEAQDRKVAEQAAETERVRKEAEAKQKVLQAKLDANAAAEEKSNQAAKREIEEKSRLEADVKHNKKMKDDAIDGLVRHVRTESDAQIDEILRAIEKGLIPNVECKWKVTK